MTLFAKKFNFSVFFSLGLMLVSCSQAPHKELIFPKALEEVSGVTAVDSRELALIEDEHGVIYIYNLDEEQVTYEIEFAKDGDFEDVLYQEETFWALRSDGTLFHIEYPFEEEPVVTEYATPLSAKNDCEGLAYEPESNSLLIACKEKAALKGEDKLKDHEKAIYRFSIDEEKLMEEPYLVYSVKAFNNFGPSALTVYCDYIAVLDSKESSVLIMDHQGNEEYYFQLDRKKFPQPEGITLRKGRFYITSEAGDELESGSLGTFKWRELTSNPLQKD
tara:strand:+ start:2407 stop:3234 length:828 start_codon:yes stop_codon:yes gene_type:complete